MAVIGEEASSKTHRPLLIEKKDIKSIIKRTGKLFVSIPKILLVVFILPTKSAK